MKHFIILPVTQTSDMEGYDAIAIEFTEATLAEINRLKSVLEQAKEIDSKVNELGYNNPTIKVELFNDDFDSFGEVIATVSDEKLDVYRESRDSAVESPSLIVREYGIRISYASKYADGEVYASIDFAELEQLNQKKYKEYLV